MYLRLGTSVINTQNILQGLTKNDALGQWFSNGSHLAHQGRNFESQGNLLQEGIGGKVVEKNLKFFFLIVYPTHKKLNSEASLDENVYKCKHKLLIIIIWASSFSQLLGHTRSQGRCWAASWSSRRPDHAKQSMGRSMDWILEDNRVNSLIFYATLTNHRSDHTPFMQKPTLSRGQE